MQLWTHRAATLAITAIVALVAGSLAFGTAHAAVEGYAEGDTASGSCAIPANALTDNNSRAICDDGEFVTVSGFDLSDAVPLGAEDISFTVRIAARVTNNDGTDVVRASLSWNAAADFTASTASALIEAETSGSDAVVTAPAGAACSTFGRTWSYPELLNSTFAVRVLADPSSASQDIQIDDIDIRPCWAGRDVQDVRVNGSSSVEVDPGDSVSVRVDVLHTAVSGLSSSADNDWESTRWLLGPSSQCVNHADFTDTDTDDVTFSVNAPANNDIFDLIITAFEDDTCGTGASETFVLNNAVDTTNGAPPSGIHPYAEGSSASGNCTNPAYAVVDDGNRALCDHGESVTLSGFDLDQLVPANAEDISFTVRVAARTSDDDGSDVALASLSWNGGSNFTAAQPTASIEAESGSDSFVLAPNTGACNTFGRTWTRSQLTDANFRVRVEADPNHTNEQISIDDVDVRVCWAGRVVDRIRIDGDTSTAVDPGDTVQLRVDVRHVDAPGVSGASDNDWESTRWLLGSNSACVNHADFVDSDVDQVTFSIPTPNEAGLFDLTIIAYRDDSCGGGASSPFVLDDAVDTRFGDVGPSFTCDDVPDDAKFWWLLSRGNPGMWKHWQNGFVPPGLRKPFVGRHSGWDWDWGDWDCNDWAGLDGDDWDDDDHRGRGHRDDDDDDD